MHPRGRVTLPTEVGAEVESLDLISRLGADAIRNSDGTTIPQEFLGQDYKVYSKYFINRGDNAWAEAHPEQLQQIYLMSAPVTATDALVRVPLLHGYFAEQLMVDRRHAPGEWWEVIDRTDGSVVDPASWRLDGDEVVITGATAWHEYTVSFLAYDIWDPVQMYNHITNDWGDREHEAPFDAFHDETRDHTLATLRNWLAANPHTDVVRFTTFFYQFTLIFNDKAKEKYVDWFGYSATVSPAALDAFEVEFGYRLRPEDFIDEGYYNNPFRLPTTRFRDWMEFVQRFVARTAKQYVDAVHESSKEAIMFLGDQWIGTEPYGDHFASIGLDAVVGSVGNGTTMRMIADIPDVSYTEGRLLPYFFPDTFHPGGDPAGEAEDSWILTRRAMLRHSVDRIGYGGYISLAAQHPDFVEVAERVTQEFRDLHEKADGTAPHVDSIKVAILNPWGKLRSWQSHTVAHAIWYKEIYSYGGVLEALAGLPVDVSFVSFDEVIAGVPEGIDVLINSGDIGTSFSGGEAWANPKLVAAIRGWVHRGGAFIGVGDPSGLVRGGRSYQLADILGVDREVGFSLNTDKYWTVEPEHYVSAELGAELNTGHGARNTYRAGESSQVLRATDGDVQLAVNDYGKGRSVYLAGLPYSAENSRLLHRALRWAAHLDAPQPWTSDNAEVEVAAFPETGWYAIVNNSRHANRATITDGAMVEHEVDLGPVAIAWRRIAGSAHPEPA